MRSRQGFTLVELMVVMALTIFIMVILTEAFIIASDTFSGLKVIGDMQEQLRTAINVFRSDLAAQHFDGNRRLSDTDIFENRPREGFFSICKTNPFSAANVEGTDADGLPSSVFNDYAIHMTVRSRSNEKQNFFACAVPALLPAPPSGNVVPFMSYPFHHYLPPVATNSPPQPNSTFYVDATQMANNPMAGTQVYRSQWAEVAYMLRKTGTTEEPGNAGTPVIPGALGLYDLVRCQYLLVPSPNETGTMSPVGTTASPGTIQDNFSAKFIYQGTPDTLVDMAAIQKFSRVPATTAGNNAIFLSPADTASGIMDTIFDLAVPTADRYGSRTLQIPHLFDPTSKTNYIPPVHQFPYEFGANAPSYRHQNYQVVLKNVVSMNVETISNNVNRTAVMGPPFGNVTIAGNTTTPIFDTAFLKFRNNAATANPNLEFIPVPAAQQTLYPVYAIKITLRIYDPSSKQTRQATFIQEM